jgi:hypothetical protein
MDSVLSHALADSFFALSGACRSWRDIVRHDVKVWTDVNCLLHPELAHRCWKLSEPDLMSAKLDWNYRYYANHTYPQAGS